MKRLGVDPGGRYVGLAWHDDPEVPARPMDTLDLRAAGVDLVASLVARARDQAADEIIVGLALRMNGGESPSSKAARSLARALRARTGLRVVLWDERLTTAQAQRARTARGERGRGEGAARIDAEAAAILLQSYVDAQRGGSGWEPESA